MPVPHKHMQPVQGTKKSLAEALPISPQKDHNLRQKELIPMPCEYKHSDKQP